jgi:hypothetical protein
MFEDFKYEEIPPLPDDNVSHKKNCTNPVLTFSIFSLLIFLYFILSSCLFPDPDGNFRCTPSTLVTNFNIITRTITTSDLENPPDFGYDFKGILTSFFFLLKQITEKD